MALTRLSGKRFWLISLLAIFCVFVLLSWSYADHSEFEAIQKANIEEIQKDLTSSNPSDYVPDELLVQLRPGVSENRAQQIYQDQGAAVIDRLPQIRTHLVRIPAAALEKVQAALAHRPEFQFVEKNRIHAPVVSPDDPYYLKQWHLPAISAPSAWDLVRGEGITIAILDSGVDPTHPDLATKLVPGYNFYDNNTDAADVYGHGTEVAGSAAAVSNNNLGVTGVAWNALLMPIRVTGSNGYAYSSTLAQGLIWAADHGARVMNMSFFGVAGDSTITSAAQYVRNLGGVVVAAAGNCGCYDSTPENPYIISVSATDSSDNLASFSSPITAGVVSLIMAANPGLAPAEVEQVLKTTADDLGDPGPDTSFGSGLVNAHQAVLAAYSSPPPLPDITPPAVAVNSPLSGESVTGTITATVSASDDVGVAKVELYLDGVLFAADAISPYTFIWDTAQSGDGPHTLTAVAYDAAGNSAASAPVSVSVANGGADTTPPTVGIMAPAAGSVVTKVVKVAVQARDNGLVSAVDFLVDGQVSSTMTCNASAVDLTFIWNTRKDGRGAHTLTAVARDEAGNQSASAPVAVSVK
jgi:thermitase